ncbi:MAG: SPFH domain-containing protein [bacterium]|nr:SPFH domain-containing protein [bacterium]
MVQNFIGYFKGEPTHHQRMTVNGKVVATGKGLACIYFPFRTNVESLAMTALDQPFSFKEITADNQEATLQGTFVYNVKEPSVVLDHYNFAIDPHTGVYKGDGPQKMPDAVLEMIRAKTRAIVQGRPLEEILMASTELSDTVLEGIQRASLFKERGLVVDVIHFSSIAPKREIAAGLETPYRESLLARADEASYARRAAAVEKERAIKENELATDVQLERGRVDLIALQARNIEAEAQAKAKALKLELEAFEGIDAEKLRAHALYLLGKNAENIGTLTIVPEVLAGLKS